MSMVQVIYISDPCPDLDVVILGSKRSLGLISLVRVNLKRAPRTAEGKDQFV